MYTIFFYLVESVRSARIISAQFAGVAPALRRRGRCVRMRAVVIFREEAEATTITHRHFQGLKIL